MSEPLVSFEHVSKRFEQRTLGDRVRRREAAATQALDDVTLAVGRGETLGLVGESGSGKTTLVRALVRLLDPDTGSIRVGGEEILGMRGARLTALRRRMQMIYQDPYSSLNPAKTVGAAIGEPALVHGLERKDTVEGRVRELMGEVGLGEGLAARKPRALSGGQRQRVAIARALAVGPEILIADEAVSALDVSVQAQILRLLARLRDAHGLTLIFVSHQLATVAQLSDRVAIMYRGRLVEVGPTAEVFANPQHEHTAALLRAHPGQGALRGTRVGG
jgi:ABC-type glutathione transport system ATPase component